MKQLCLNQKWLYPTDSIVRLFPRNDKARRILVKESHHWTVRPLPQDTNDIERHLLLKGWIVVRSMIGTTEADDRWVHVSRDNNFHVVVLRHTTLPQFTINVAKSEVVFSLLALGDGLIPQLIFNQSDAGVTSE